MQDWQRNLSLSLYKQQFSYRISKFQFLFAPSAVCFWRCCTFLPLHGCFACLVTTVLKYEPLIWHLVLCDTLFSFTPTFLFLTWLATFVFSDTCWHRISRLWIGELPFCFVPLILLQAALWLLSWHPISMYFDVQDKIKMNEMSSAYGWGGGGHLPFRKIHRALLTWQQRAKRKQLSKNSWSSRMEN
jgi:hypothetical protein